MNNELMYNDIAIDASLKKFSEKYEEFFNKINVDFQNRVINEMSRYWFGNDAIENFKNVIEVMDELVNYQINPNMVEIHDYILKHTLNWARAVQAHVTFDTSFTTIKSTLNISGFVLENSAGNSGVFPEEATAVLEDMLILNNEISIVLRDMSRVLDVESFKGEDQVVIMKNKIEYIGKKISDAITSICKTWSARIDLAVQEYRGTAAKVANIIQTGSVGVSSGANPDRGQAYAAESQGRAYEEWRKQKATPSSSPTTESTTNNPIDPIAIKDGQKIVVPPRSINQDGIINNSDEYIEVSSPSYMEKMSIETNPSDIPYTNITNHTTNEYYEKASNVIDNTKNQ